MSNTIENKDAYIQSTGGTDVPNNNPFATKETGNDKNLIINQIILRNTDRTPKDISRWRDALINAESIYYPNRTRLYDLYADVILDGMLTGLINKRMDAVLNKALYFRKDDKDVEALEPILKSHLFRKLIREILNTQFWGITGFEFIPGKDFDYEVIPRKHIKPELGVIAPEQNYYEGIPYEKLPNIWVIGDKRSYGMLLQCSPYVLYKKGCFADWAQYVEIFGQPIRVYKYDSNDAKTTQDLKREMDTAGGSLSIAIPKMVDFEILDGKISNGDGKLQDSLVKACNNELSIIILGNTETTGNSNGGSNAKAKTQAQQQLEITKADLQYVLDMLNSQQFLNILKSYGFPVDGGYFDFENAIDMDTMKDKIAIDTQLNNIVPINPDYWYDTYGIPKPNDLEAAQNDFDEKNKKPLITTTQNFNEGEDAQTSPVVKPPVPAEKLQQPKIKLSAWHKIRQTLADFFDPAP